MGAVGNSRVNLIMNQKTNKSPPKGNSLLRSIGIFKFATFLVFEYEYTTIILKCLISQYCICAFQDMGIQNNKSFIAVRRELF